MEGGTPFHIVARYEQFTPDGKPDGTGSLEELWQNPRRYRQIFTLPDMEEIKSATGTSQFRQRLTAPPRTLVEVDSGTQAWRTGEWVLSGIFFTPILKPFAFRPVTGNRLSSEPSPPANPTLECIGAEPDLPGVPPEARLALTTYCLDPGTHLLRIIQRPNEMEWTFNEVRQFGGKYIPRAIEIRRKGRLWYKIHVDLLEPAGDSAELDVPPPASAQLLQFHRADFPLTTGELMHGQLLKKVSPQYAQAGLRGTITVKLHVNTSGEVESTEIIEAQNQILKAPVLAAVKDWRFRVSYQGTKPVAVDYLYRFSYNGDELLQ